MNKSILSLTVIIIIIMVIAASSVPVVNTAVFAGSAGDATAQVLQLGAGAKIPAMGGSGQATVRGPAALHYNPAGLAGGTGQDLEFSYQKLVEDVQFGNFDYTMPFNDNFNFAAGLRYLAYGSEDKTVWSGGPGSSLEKDGSFSGSDIVLSGALAARLYSNISWGVSGRLIRLEIDDENALGASFDLGGQWVSPNSAVPLSAGLVLQNVGPGLKFDRKTEDLPLGLVAGASLDLQAYLDQPIWIHTDLDYQVHDSEIFLKIGSEWQAHQLLSLRLGFDGSLGVDNGLTYGLGFGIPDSAMEIDYALIPYGDFGTVHRLALNYSF